MALSYDQKSVPHRIWRDNDRLDQFRRFLAEYDLIYAGLVAFAVCSFIAAAVVLYFQNAA